MNTWFSRRIKLELIPPFEKETIVSTERVKDFKEWLNQQIQDKNSKSKDKGVLYSKFLITFLNIKLETVW